MQTAVQTVRQGPLTLHVTPYIAGIVDYTVERPNSGWWTSAALGVAALSFAWTTRLVQWLSSFSPALNPLLVPFMVSTALMALVLQLQLQTVVRESILVLPGIGIQLTKYSHTFRSLIAGSPHLHRMISQTFVPASSIHSILLNEGFHRSRVVYYLAIVLHGSSEMLIPFQCTMPRLHILQTVWNGVLDRMPNAGHATGVK